MHESSSTFNGVTPPHRGGGRERVLRVSPMSKKQLALAYAPELSESGAYKRLHQWLHFNKQLMSDLYAANYQDSQRVFTGKQVAIIFQYLGEP